MQAKINTYKKEGRLAIRHMWIVVILFALADIIVAVIVADVNTVNIDGITGAAFAAIWQAFLVLFFLYTGSQVVYAPQSSPLMVGFVLGFATMMAQLFFMLCVYFLALGVQATTLGYATDKTDKAMGAFCFLNMIIYFVFACILSCHRATVTAPGRPSQTRYKNSSDYDPTINEDYGDEEQV